MKINYTNKEKPEFAGNEEEKPEFSSTIRYFLPGSV